MLYVLKRNYDNLLNIGTTSYEENENVTTINNLEELSCEYGIVDTLFIPLNYHEFKKEDNTCNEKKIKLFITTILAMGNANKIVLFLEDTSSIDANRYRYLIKVNQMILDKELLNYIKVKKILKNNISKTFRNTINELGVIGKIIIIDSVSLDEAIKAGISISKENVKKLERVKKND